MQTYVNFFMSILWCMIILWSIKTHEKTAKQKSLLTINHKDFRVKVRDGDLIATCASNNIMSRFHAVGLDTPISHVGIALVEKIGDEIGRIYIFEAGAPRGAQLRDLDDYMKDGAEKVWWVPLKATQEQRNKIINIISSFSSIAYSWSFLKNLPSQIFGFHYGIIEEDTPCSCGELIARIYSKAGIILAAREYWLPMHFLSLSSTHKNPQNIIFEGVEDLEQIRFSKLADSFANEMIKSF